MNNKQISSERLEEIFGFGYKTGEKINKKVTKIFYKTIGMENWERVRRIKRKFKKPEEREWAMFLCGFYGGMESQEEED